MARRAVNILPGVSVLALMRHMNYRPWFALAEFVDNSLESFLNQHHSLRKVDGRNYVLTVAIDYDPSDEGQIVIRDNAAGIHDQDYDRAFKTAETPPDTSGLSEFGMGMKSAASWFARKWSVRSKALGENQERYIAFDIDAIVENKIEVLPVSITAAPADQHYTELVLSELHKPMHGPTIGKIKRHLASIYRIFTRKGTLKLTFNGEELTYDEPLILKAAWFKDPEGKKRLWRKEFDIQFNSRKRVSGFAALRETASVSDAGFAIFRRNRLIEGSADEGYRPQRIFRKSNSYTYQRLFGELYVEGYDVSHTKDGIRWDDDEDAILEELAKEINRPPVPLLDQAEGYRARVKKPDARAAAVAALSAVVAVQKTISHDLGSQGDAAVADPVPQKLKPSPKPFQTEMVLQLESTTWVVTIEATMDASIGDWLSVSDSGLDVKLKSRRVGIRISLIHPFMVRYAGSDSEQLEPLVRLAVGIGLAELKARDAGVKLAGAIRHNLNHLLRSSLSQAG